ncbi:NUDIX hydrolase [Reinekea thalattae]|uniref:8-oxo-dGTP diphosphatase n=1 Tax=Reinekea thalattae TaxID=2593301 RepID=A0A5C8Z5F0_9GAMM|nr:NUDIX domain-containing protein [Reinekea thalattae]TXR53192.1 NUDIX domain-containing protein [Reinekea thalattae]
MQPNECVSFLVISDGKILLEKRSELREVDPGTINIPGGHIENDETQSQALYRELSEELGIVPITYHFLCSLYHPTSELQLIHYYVVTSWEGEAQPFEAEDISWYSLAEAPVGINVDKVALSEFKRVSGSLGIAL